MDNYKFNKTEFDILGHETIEMSIKNFFDMADEYPEFDLDVALRATESAAKRSIIDYIKKEVTNKEYPMWDKGYDILKNRYVFGRVIFANFRQRDKKLKKNPMHLTKIDIANDGKHNIMLDMPISVIYNFKVDKDKKMAVVQFKYNDCGCWMLEDF